MIFAWIRFGLCALCLITAMVCFTAAVLGANRFGFIMNRVHAGGVGDTLGLFLIALSIILGDGFHMGELKLCFITSSASSLSSCGLPPPCLHTF